MIQTDRLILRHWQEEDLGPFFALNSDPRVMEFFPALLRKEQSDQLAKSFQSHIDEYGWGFWVAALAHSGEFIGFIGLQNMSFLPGVEIGWRIAYPHWGKGYAPEGATAALQYGFQILHLREIVSFTAVGNMRSRKVMEKIGMAHDPQDDFEHPKLSEGHPLRKHVLYKIKNVLE